MDKPIKLIIGLGNPGAEYQKTRHNAGFWFVDALAHPYGALFKPEKKFNADMAKIRVNGDDVFLLKPMMFMNRSGYAAASLMQYYKIPVAQILVVYDELDFPAGTIRFKQGGGHGGHNGLRDIIAQSANNKDFLRLRIGIGHPGASHLVSNYVLGKPSISDRQKIMESIDSGLAVIDDLVLGERQKALQNLHS